jgi:hypothetical protein
MSFEFYKNKSVLVVVISSLVSVILFCSLKIIIDKTVAISAFSNNVKEEQVFIIDRLEGNFAVCEGMDGLIFNYKIVNLPKSIKEGDVISKMNGKCTVKKNDTLDIDERADKLWN